MSLLQKGNTEGFSGFTVGQNIKVPFFCYRIDGFYRTRGSGHGGKRAKGFYLQRGGKTQLKPEANPPHKTNTQQGNPNQHTGADGQTQPA